MRIQRKLLVSALLFCATFSVSAGLLVSDATVTKVGTTNWNKRVFFIVIEGGTGHCANGSINFPEDFAQSTVAYAHMYSMAMMAYLHKKKIRVHNYGNQTYVGDNICTGGNYIEIYD